jgi:alginate O-acetyltransferase complex protein AlgI
MLFNSPEFFVYFAIVYTLYRVLPFRGQNAMLLVAGYVFYGWWDVRFLFLIAFSTVVDFNVGLMLGEGRVPLSKRITSSVFLLVAYLVFVCVHWSALHVHAIRMSDLIFPLDVIDWVAFPCIVLLVLIANLLHGRVARMPPPKRRTVMLITTVAVNVTFLAFFKYFNFFIGSAETALRSLGWNAELFHLNVLLPVGISFYTFQSLSYTIDAARGLVQPTRSFWEFALFVAYFPPMVAGPIERGRHLLPQLQRPRRIRLEQSVWGVVLILIGLFKKVAIADSIAPSVNAVYNHAGPVSAFDVIGATLLFAVQIFCDFSGYSDIAIGVSKMLGIELITNFNLPYFSRNPSEFWRRWHISLSSWLRDYVYIPLGGNQKGDGRTST